MALAIAEPTTAPAPAVPTCCGQPMRAVTTFVTQRVFNRCDTCLGNDYSQYATHHPLKD